LHKILWRKTLSVVFFLAKKICFIELSLEYL